MLLPINTTLSGSIDPAAAATSTLVFETGSGRLIWAGSRSDGGFVPGTDGVNGAQPVALFSGQPAVAASVGSGTYSFEILQVPGSGR